MHDAEKIALTDAPYLITDHDNVVAVTYNDTWDGLRARSRPAPARRSATRGCSCS